MKNRAVHTFYCHSMIIVSLLCISIMGWAGDKLPGTTTPTPTGTQPTPTNPPTETPEPTATPTKEPRCKGCAPFTATFKECSHLSTFPRTDCTTGYFFIVFDTASCNKTNGTGPADCDCDTVDGYAGKVEVYAAYPGQPCETEEEGEWTLWKTLYYGCGSDCEPDPLVVACRPSYWYPDWQMLLLKQDKGHKRKCGCNEPTSTPTPFPTDTPSPTMSPTPPK